MEAVIFSPKNKEELELLRQLAKQMRIKATVLSEEDMEDAVLLKGMLEGRTGEEASRDEVFKALS
jgi:hypothetical protein